MLAIFIARFLASLLDDWRARGLAIAGAWACCSPSACRSSRPPAERPRRRFAGGGALLLALSFVFERDGRRRPALAPMQLLRGGARIARRTDRDLAGALALGF